MALVLALAGLFGWARLRGAGAEPAQPTQAVPFTLFLLGGSTALGEPYDPRADIGRIADWLLAGEVGGLPLRVVNMADAGKASAAVVDDARRIADEPPPRGTAVALLYLGNNEFLRFDDEHDLTRNTRALFDEPTLPPVAQATVLETYGRNIERIVDALQQAGVGVIASSVAVNQKDWEPNRSVLGDPSHGPELKRLLAEGERERGAPPRGGAGRIPARARAGASLRAGLEARRGLPARPRTPERGARATRTPSTTTATPTARRPSRRASCARSARAEECRWSTPPHASKPRPPRA